MGDFHCAFTITLSEGEALLESQVCAFRCTKVGSRSSIHGMVESKLVLECLQIVLEVYSVSLNSISTMKGVYYPTCMTSSLAICKINIFTILVECLSILPFSCFL
jgi:hypothetical protein